MSYLGVGYRLRDGNPTIIGRINGQCHMPHVPGSSRRDLSLTPKRPAVDGEMISATSVYDTVEGELGDGILKNSFGIRPL